MSLPCHATTLLLNPHGQWSLNYRGWIFVVQTELQNEQKAKLIKFISFGGFPSFFFYQHVGPLAKNRRWKPIHRHGNGSLLQAIQTARTTTTNIYNIFMKLWVANFKILCTVLIEKRPKFTSRLFSALCKELGVKKVTTSKYRLQDNEHVQQFKTAMAWRLPHYVVEQRDDWDKFVFPLTYAHNIQVHRTTKLPPLSLSITRLMPQPANRTRSMPKNVSETD